MRIGSLFGQGRSVRACGWVGVEPIGIPSGLVQRYSTKSQLQATGMRTLWEDLTCIYTTMIFIIPISLGSISMSATRCPFGDAFRCRVLTGLPSPSGHGCSCGVRCHCHIWHTSGRRAFRYTPLPIMLSVRADNCVCVCVCVFAFPGHEYAVRRLNWSTCSSIHCCIGPVLQASK